MTIFGITTEDIKNYEDLFDVILDDSESFLAVSKETFKHDEEENNRAFEYKYIIEAVYCEGSWFYSLEFVINPKDMHESIRAKICDSCDVDDENVAFENAHYYGCTIPMGTERVDGEELSYDVINGIASVFEIIDRLRGFYLDKYQNRIGNTGWDYIDEFVNGNNAFEKVLKR